MENDRWVFDKSRLANSPSRLHGIPEEKELSYIQQVSNFIQEMGRKLEVPLLCINTAVLFTQRFYVFHSLSVFEKYSLAASALFLAGKVEENLRPAEFFCIAARQLGVLSENRKDSDYIQELIFNENALVQTLGFDLLVQHPHQHVLKLCNLVKANKEISQTAYFLATHCLHLTKMCLAYRSSVIACVCIHLACRALNWQIPVSREGKEWFSYVDKTVTIDLLENLTDEFLSVYTKCPAKYKFCIQKLNTNLSKHLAASSTLFPHIASKPTQPDCHHTKSIANVSNEAIKNNSSDMRMLEENNIHSIAHLKKENTVNSHRKNTDWNETVGFSGSALPDAHNQVSHKCLTANREIDLRESSKQLRLSNPSIENVDSIFNKVSFGSSEELSVIVEEKQTVSGEMSKQVPLRTSDPIIESAKRENTNPKINCTKATNIQAQNIPIKPSLSLSRNPVFTKPSVEKMNMFGESKLSQSSIKMVCKNPQISLLKKHSVSDSEKLRLSIPRNTIDSKTTSHDDKTEYESVPRVKRLKFQ